MKEQRALLDKQMSRKEFLQFLGSSLVILLGLPNFIQLIQRTAGKKQQSSQATNGFGSRKFGA